MRVRISAALAGLVLMLGATLISNALAQEPPRIERPDTFSELVSYCRDFSRDGPAFPAALRLCRVLNTQEWIASAATVEDAVWDIVLQPFFESSRPRGARLVRRVHREAGLDEEEAEALAAFAEQAVLLWRASWVSLLRENVCNEPGFEGGEALGRALNEVRRIRDEDKVSLVHQLADILGEEAAAKVVSYALEHHKVHYSIDLEAYYSGWPASAVAEVVALICHNGAAFLLE